MLRSLPCHPRAFDGLNEPLVTRPFVHGAGRILLQTRLRCRHTGRHPFGSRPVITCTFFPGEGFLLTTLRQSSNTVLPDTKHVQPMLLCELACNASIPLMLPTSLRPSSLPPFPCLHICFHSLLPARLFPPSSPHPDHQPQGHRRARGSYPPSCGRSVQLGASITRG